MNPAHANPKIQTLNYDDEWDGRPARVGRSINRNWDYKVRILGEARYDDDPDVKALAERALNRLGDFRGFDIAEDGAFHDALGWFEDAKESGSVEDFDEALHCLYDWGDSNRIVIS